MTVHHPAPWTYTWVEVGGYDCMSDAYVISDAKHNTIATIDTNMMGTRDSTPWLEECAALMCAAPDLLEACERTLDLLNSAYGQLAPCEPGHDCTFDALRAAIVKAKGGPS